MSVFVLKMIALLSMVLDHYAFVQNSMTGTDVTLLRGVGRMAFPIYLIMIINGYYHTKDYHRYLASVAKLAAFSQPIYSQIFRTPPDFMAFLPAKSYTAHIGDLTIDICNVYFAIATALAIFLIVSYMPKYSEFLVPLLVMANFRITYRSFLILNNDLSILCTFVACLLLLDIIHKHEDYTAGQFISIIPYIGLLIFISDAGIISCLVILLSLICSNDKYVLCIGTAILISVRNVVVYGMPLWYIVPVCFACLLVLFYNNRLGVRCKQFFYWMYPTHLLILAIYQHLFS